MKELILCIEKNQSKEFIDHLATLLKDSSFDIDQTFDKKDSRYSEIWTHTLFSYSCLYGNLEICKHLASKNADPIGKKSRIGEGFPLAISILHNRFHISEWLQSTFNIDCSINNSWPLTMSARHGNLSAVKYSLNHNADIHADQNKPLQWAALCGHLDIVKYLISKDANIHAENDYALRYAIWNNQFKTAEYLLDHGADPNVKDKDGHILQWLVAKNQLDLAARAISSGADLSVLSSGDQQKLREFLVSNRMVKKRCL